MEKLAHRKRFGDVVRCIADLAAEVTKYLCFELTGLATPVFVDFEWILHSINKYPESPTADDADIVEEVCPFDESRAVISVKEIHCVFGGTLEESTSSVDGNDVAMRLKVVERVQIIVLASAWEVGEKIFNAHRRYIGRGRRRDG